MDWVNKEFWGDYVENDCQIADVFVNFFKNMLGKDTEREMKTDRRIFELGNSLNTE